MIAGPGKNETAATANRGHGSLRASRADREEVIGTLKAAFVQGMLAKDEFDLRVEQAFAAQTYTELVAVIVDLAAVTADLAVESTAARPPRAAGTRGEDGKPVLRPGHLAVGATALYAGVWAFTFLPDWPTNSEGDSPGPIVMLFGAASLVYLFVLVIAAGFMIADGREQRSGLDRR